MTNAIATTQTAPTRKSNPCYRCGGTGIYSWGTVVNGVPSFSGTCFRCNGNGIDPSAKAKKVVKVESEVLKSFNKFAAEMERVAKTGTEEQVRTIEGILSDLILTEPANPGAFYGPNVIAYVLESVRRVIDIRFPAEAETESESEQDSETAPAVDPIPNGTYTIETEDGHFTFRIKPGTVKLEGRTIIEYLYGADNEMDFRAFGFVKEDRTITVWTRFQHSTVGKVRAQQIVKAFMNADTLEAAGQAYALKSGRCRRCGRTLTVPASINQGYGPDCFEKVQ